MMTRAAPAFWACLLLTALWPAWAGRATAEATPAWPEGRAPREVGERLVANLLARETLPSLGKRLDLHYSESCTYLGALRFTALTRDEASQRRLLERLDELLLSVDGRRKVPHEYHVDPYMFGAVPLEAFLATRDRHYLLAGENYAVKQWRDPRSDGLTKQTRFWIDDMYMVGVLQAQAYRATADATYIDQAARQLDAYATRLQQPNGLFHHGEDSTRFWGRGNGWVASAFAEVLSAMPEDHPKREVLLRRCRAMMEALLTYQDEDGVWRQLLDDPDAWVESSCSGMFTYAFAVGAKKGWLDAKFADAARRGWIGLCDYINGDGDVREVCVGTGQSDDRGYYLKRPRAVGDFHGQAASLWAATALVAMESSAGE